MKKSRIQQLGACVLLMTILLVWPSMTPVQGQSVTWQVLPFPQSDWPGPYGQPATTNGNLVTIRGQPVRTVETYSGPLRISFDVVLDSRATPDGALTLFFLPLGLSTTQLTPSLSLAMVFRNYGSDGLLIQQGFTWSSNTVVWGEAPFSISAQSVYHVTVDVTGSGGLTWIVNNLTNSIPNSVQVTYSQFQMELMGWTPEDTWYVSNFTAVPEPATAMLVGVGLACILIGIRRGRSRPLDL